MRIFLGHELACLLLFQLRKKLVAKWKWITTKSRVKWVVAVTENKKCAPRIIKINNLSKRHCKDTDQIRPINLSYALFCCCCCCFWGNRTCRGRAHLCKWVSHEAVFSDVSRPGWRWWKKIDGCEWGVMKLQWTRHLFLYQINEGIIWIELCAMRDSDAVNRPRSVGIIITIAMVSTVKQIGRPCCSFFFWQTRGLLN